MFGEGTSMKAALNFLLEFETLYLVIQMTFLVSIGIALYGDTESAYLLLVMSHFGLLYRLSTVVRVRRDGP